MRTFQVYQDFIISKGVDLLSSQPTEGNIRGGLTTIEEKAMGNIGKMDPSPIQSVRQPAEEPKGPALHFMDRSSATAEMVTLCDGLDQAAEVALGTPKCTIRGRLTAAEVLCHNEFVLTKLYRSAQFFLIPPVAAGRRRQRRGLPVSGFGGE